MTVKLTLEWKDKKKSVEISEELIYDLKSVCGLDAEEILDEEILEFFHEFLGPIIQEIKNNKFELINKKN